MVDKRNRLTVRDGRIESIDVEEMKIWSSML